MRTHYIILILLALAKSILAQTNHYQPHYAIKKQIKNNPYASIYQLPSIHEYYFLTLSQDKGQPTGQLRQIGTKSENWSPMQNDWTGVDSTITIYHPTLGKKNTEKFLLYDGAINTWKNNYQNIHEYDSQGRLIRTTVQYWITGGWINTNKVEYMYNNNDSIIEEISSSNSGGNWVYTNKKIYYYNLLNQKEIVTILIWNNTTNAWENYARILNAYNENNYLTNSVYQMWDGSTWENYNKSIFYVNNTEEYIGSRYYEWDNLSSSWIIQARDTIIKLSSTQEEVYFYSNFSGTLEPSQKFINNYTSNKILIERIIQNWNSSLSSYENNTKHTYTLDLQENYAIHIEYYWNISTNQFDNYLKEEFTHNSFNYLSYYLQKNWNIATNSWKNAIQKFYWYEFNPFFGLNVETENTSIPIYPNPCYEEIWIDLKNTFNEGAHRTVKIISLTGQVLIQNTYTESLPNEQLYIPLHTLPRGAYLLLLEINNSVLTKTIIKQ